jgi:peroxiredoxin
MNVGWMLAVLSLLVITVAVTWTNVSGRPLPAAAERWVAFAGLVLSGTALLIHPGTVGYAIGGVAFAISGFFFFLTFMSGLPDQRAAVAIGRRAPDFRALDSEGEEFRLSALAGSRVLLKFFRGTWCPYCVADLRLWNARHEELRELGLKLVAVSHDSVSELRDFKRKHAWDIALVADPELEIIRRYNLQNHNFTPKRGPFRDMAIPANILIDVDGTVLWMSQASDFRVRIHPDRVLADVRRVLDPGARAAALRRPTLVASEEL